MDQPARRHGARFTGGRTALTSLVVVGAGAL